MFVVVYHHSSICFMVHLYIMYCVVRYFAEQHFILLPLECVSNVLNE